jgi:hypothetical protein
LVVPLHANPVLHDPFAPTEQAAPAAPAALHVPAPPPLSSHQKPLAQVRLKQDCPAVGLFGAWQSPTDSPASFCPVTSQTSPLAQAS